MVEREVRSGGGKEPWGRKGRRRVIGMGRGGKGKGEGRGRGREEQEEKGRRSVLANKKIMTSLHPGPS